MNARTERYALAYKELRDLTEIFRAYVASVKIVRQDSEVCPVVRSMPLHQAERTSTPLPAFHPSELFINVIRHVKRQGNKRNLSLTSGTSFSGGIALRGREFFDASSVTTETQVIADLKRELSAPVAPAPQPVWKGESGRRYIVLNLLERGPGPVPAIASDAPSVLASVVRPTEPTSANPQDRPKRFVIARTANRKFTAEGYKFFVGATYAQCEQVCLNETACAAIGFHRSNNGCELFNEVVPSREGQMVDIGIKQSAPGR